MKQGQGALPPILGRGGRARWPCLLLASYLVLVAVRIPNILLKGRFWAEEGSKFFVLAWSLPWWRALLSPWGGYLNITANLGGLLAWYVTPHADAPYATTLLAFAIQLCPPVLLLTSRIAWLNRPAFTIAALLMLLVPPASGEIWLSSIGSQVHLALCVALILALEPRGGWVGAFRLALIALSALSGPGAWLLAPLFAVRAALERSRWRLAQAATLVCFVTIQALAFYSHQRERTYAIRPLLFLDVAYVKHVLLPLLGPQRTLARAERLYATVIAGHVPLWPALVVCVIAAALIGALWKHWRSEAAWLLLAAVVMIGISYVGVLGDVSHMLEVNGAGRYTYAPQVLISLAVLGIAARNDWAGWVATVAAAWLLTVGMIYYFVPTWSIFVDGPSWRTEFALHTHDRSHRIASWPPGWYIAMPDDTVPLDPNHF